MTDAPATERAPGLYLDMPEDRYHSDPAISTSTLKRFADAPAKVLVPRPDTNALSLGRLLHTVLLEPSTFERRYVVNDLNRNTNAFRALREEEDKAGRSIIKTSEWETALAIRDAVLEQPVARDLLPWIGSEYAVTEASFWWPCPHTGLMRRGRADLLLDSPNMFATVDLKSCDRADPRSFAKACAEYRYDWQAASYMQGLAHPQVCGRQPETMIFLAIEKEPPYLVGAYQIDPRDIDAADVQVEALMRRYAECRNANHWPGYTETLETISLPAWAATRGA